MTSGLVIAIGGCTCSGKSTLSTWLKNNYDNVTVFHTDDFYKEVNDSSLPWLPEYENKIADWECLESFNVAGLVDAFEQHLKEIKFKNKNLTTSGNNNHTSSHNNNNTTLLNNNYTASHNNNHTTSHNTNLTTSHNNNHTTSHNNNHTISHNNTTSHKNNKITTSPHITVLEGIFAFAIPELQSYFDLRYFLDISFETALPRRRLQVYPVDEPDDYFLRVAWPAHLTFLQHASNQSNIKVLGEEVGHNGIRDVVCAEIDECLNEIKKLTHHLSLSRLLISAI